MARYLACKGLGSCNDIQSINQSIKQASNNLFAHNTSSNEANNHALTIFINDVN